MIRISISIVVYQSNPTILSETIRHLSLAVGRVREGRALWCSLSLIHNDHCLSSGAKLPDLVSKEALAVFDHCDELEPSQNVGYGAGHNLVILAQDSDYHLVLNPDAYMEQDSLQLAIEYLEQQSAVGLVSPLVTNPAGTQEFLCKAYPSVAALFIRGFVPAPLQAPFRRYLANYELKAMHQSSEPCHEVPIASGCCMLARTSLLQAIGGFSPVYFLYFEDFDLSLRLANQAQLAYLPAMRIIHHGGYSSSKGWWHIRQFGFSAWRFFNEHGWRWV